MNRIAGLVDEAILAGLLLRDRRRSIPQEIRRADSPDIHPVLVSCQRSVLFQMELAS